MAAGDCIRIERWADIRELALMSIGTDKGAWWADPGFGSELWLLKKEGRVDGRTAGILERMVRDSLRWLVDDGLAAAADCTAERSGKNRIDYQVDIRRPDGSLAEPGIKEVWDVI
ncbi:MAG: phage GP46 family protein [Treponema sp.]|jgi:phage gp46-like protein|nr:phage GP46 family protein [Treponema sp.]